MTASIPGEVLDLFEALALDHVSFFIDIARVGHSGTWGS